MKASWLNYLTGKLKTEPAQANASAPTWTEGQTTSLSTDLSGNLRVSGTVTSIPSGTQNVNVTNTSLAVTQSGTWTTGRTWSLSNSTDSVNVGNFPSTQQIAVQSVGDTIDSQNSTTTPLGISGVFTGAWVNTLNYSQVVVMVYSDKNSAANGLAIQFSTDGVNVDHQHVYSSTGGSGEEVQVHTHAKFYRVVFTNDGVAQTVFRLQSILRPVMAQGTIIEADDTITNSDDCVLTKSILTGFSTAGGGAFVDVKVSPSGAIQVGGTIVTQDQDTTGTWGYVSNTLSSGSLTGVGRCIGIRVFANGADGTFNINGGNTVTVRNGAGFDMNPRGTVTAPVVNWLSGSLDVTIEGLS